jgi:TIR domain/Pentapeptide repeats (8 copies)
MLSDLNRANLSHASLSGANLNSTNLKDADLTQAHFIHTTFARVNLSEVKGLDTTSHTGPSSVDINSVILPHDESTRLYFLRGVGFTETQIEYLPSLLIPRPIQYQSLFISYAHQDDAIAKRLYADLRKKDVPCWFAPHDLRPGDYHHSRIDEAIHLHEKVLLLLSEHAVNSSWVKHEVQVALAREIKQDCTVLFPLCLDQAVMQTSKDWAVRLRESRHIGDFTRWQDEAAYQEAFSRLLRDLKVTFA